MFLLKLLLQLLQMGADGVRLLDDHGGLLEEAGMTVVVCRELVLLEDLHGVCRVGEWCWW